MCKERSEIASSLEAYVERLRFADVTSAQAGVLLEFFAHLGRLALSGSALCASVVASSDGHEKKGHRSAEAGLAEALGGSTRTARNLVEIGRQMRGVESFADALFKGELSLDKAAEVAGALASGHDGADDLVERARNDTLGGLRRASAEHVARQSSEDDRKDALMALHESRSLRHFVGRDGALNLSARLAPDVGAAIVSALEDRARMLRREAASSKIELGVGASLADALFGLVSAGQASKLPPSYFGPLFSAVVRVDAETLRAGEPGPNGTCEIQGVGPVPVDFARQLLGDSFFKLLVTSGHDVVAVAHHGRSVNAHQRSAITERDRRCVVPGCEMSFGLEIDHYRIDWAKGGPTALWNLARLCHHHHRMKTLRGFSLEGGPGAWRWVTPDDRRRAEGSSPAPPDAASPAHPASTPR